MVDTGLDFRPVLKKMMDAPERDLWAGQNKIKHYSHSFITVKMTLVISDSQAFVNKG